MAFSVSRLTIYALLSAVEEDLRAMLSNAFGPSTDPENAMGEPLFESANRRLVDELGAVRRRLTLDELLPYTDLGDLVDLLNRHRALLPVNVRDQLVRLNPQLQLLMPVRKRIAHVRPFRYDDLARVTAFTDHVSADDANTWQNVTEALARLTQDPSFVFRLPEPRYDAPLNAPYNNLPLPDYDDTGFFGRDTEVRQVLALCKGPWPVISLVGEGGLGKTALALQIANDLLDDPERPFEAIIWSSCKTNQLTATQISEISGAIRDSVGLFEKMAGELGAVGDADPESELVEFLKTFRTLLILDNLETILDERVRRFINRLPLGSKILITSRIGVGEFENRMKVQPLPTPVAASLLRAVARAGGLVTLARLPEQQISEMCMRMTNNPLFIKWFVSAVQVGCRPEDLLAHPDLFLDFCMSNVYGHLSVPARGVLSALLAIPEELTLAEVTYFNGGDAFEAQAALQELLTTNMMVMNSLPRGTVVESRYAITELARLYLNKHHPLSRDDDHSFEVLKRSLESERALLGKKIEGDPYDYYTVSARSRSDYIVAKYLLEALNFAESGRFDDALNRVTTAKQLAPDYYEVYRIEAQVFAASSNLRAADTAFQAALEIEPQSAPLRLFYAAFFREVRHDIDAALIQVAVALHEAPDDPYVLLEHARCNLDLLAFDAARKSIERAVQLARKGGDQAEAWLLAMQLAQREAIFALETGDYRRAAETLGAVRQVFERSPIALHSQLGRYVAESYGTAWCIINESDSPPLVDTARASVSWLQGIPGLRSPASVILSNDRTVGQVRWRNPSQPFGFVVTEDNIDVFLSRSNMRVPSDFDLLHAGSAVSFVMAAGEKGRKALDATPN